MGKYNRAKQVGKLRAAASKAREHLMPHAKAAREGLAGWQSHREQETLAQMQLDRAARWLESRRSPWPT